MAIYTGSKKRVNKLKESGSPDMIQPRQARLVAYWTETLYTKLGNAGYPWINVSFGAGARNPEKDGTSYSTSVGEIIRLFKDNSKPLENIIVIERNKRICEEWEGTGPKFLRSDWNHKSTFEKLSEEIRSISKSKHRNLIIHFDNYDGLENMHMIGRYLNVNKPMAAIIPFYIINYSDSTINRIRTELKKFKNYKQIDMGFAENFSDREKFKGFIKMPGSLLLTCIQRFEVELL